MCDLFVITKACIVS